MKKLSILLFSIFFGLTANLLLAESSAPQEEFSDAELEQMLAPVALYPDSVLTHILIASTYPLEAVQANRWRNKNADLQASELLNNAEDKDWDPSVKALLPFPRILERLSEDLEWTQKLGDAFLQNEARVLSSIQSLRRRADQAGNLQKMENMTVTRDADKIIIQPVKTEVVYIPYYDTRVVYGSWYWNHYPPVYWDWGWYARHNHHFYRRPHRSVFSWHPGVHISFDFFFSAFHWHNHHVVVVDHRRPRHYQRPHHRPHRSYILKDKNARRWKHSPKHRRGLAYRTEVVRHRYQSSRPSYKQTRVVRNKEGRIVKKTTIKKFKNNPNQRVLLTPQDSKKRTLSRQQRLQQKLKKEEKKTQKQYSKERVKKDKRVQQREEKKVIRKERDDKASSSGYSKDLRQNYESRKPQQKAISRKTIKREAKTENDRQSKQTKSSRVQRDDKKSYKSSRSRNKKER